MQRRHFNAIAATLRDAKPETDNAAVVAKWLGLCHDFAAMCAREYRGGMGFDRARFLRACGVDA
jgi:hypothetical protein